MDKHRCITKLLYYIELSETDGEQQGSDLIWEESILESSSHLRQRTSRFNSVERNVLDHNWVSFCDDGGEWMIGKWPDEKYLLTQSTWSHVVSRLSLATDGMLPNLFCYVQCLNKTASLGEMLLSTCEVCRCLELIDVALHQPPGGVKKQKHA